MVYQAEDGSPQVQVRILNETVWLSQRQLAELFQKDVRTINEHIQNVFEEGELDKNSTIRRFRIVQIEGSRSVVRDVDHYNLDVIISVGYRVRSHVGTRFRQWATQRLREYIIKGFTLDDARLKEGRNLTSDYFDELLERVRAIRASERRFYQKITDIYATSIDYEANHPTTSEFFATVQNKLHWAIHGHTAAEIIAKRADASKPNMGLSTWKNAPAGRITKADIHVAKNYLTENELRLLNLIVDQYLDAFLQLNDREIMQSAGAISAEMAKELADIQYSDFDLKRRKFEAENPVSDFDKAIKDIKRISESE